MRLTIDTGFQLNPYRLIPLALILWPAGNAAADRLLAHYIPSHWPYHHNIAGRSTDQGSRLLEGDKVAGYSVTSPYRLGREHPVTGETENHYGVDVATPVGTKLIAPEQIAVTCWWDSDGGGEVATVTSKATGDVYQLLHLSSCAGGTYPQGTAFARTGNTGIGTGPHLDIRRGDKAEPVLEEVEPFLTGKPATPVLRDVEIVCAIGAAEGTRESDCSPNEHFESHTDPGNGVENIGTFSYQHGATSPAEADRKQLRRLRGAERSLQAQAKAKWGRPLSKAAIATALDLWNQSPAAGTDFVTHLPTPTPTEAQIIAARAASYVDPATGQLDAPGLGNKPAKVTQDQARRTGEVLYQLEKNAVEKSWDTPRRQKTPSP